jgi:AraC-like DNA-binding protein
MLTRSVVSMDERFLARCRAIIDEHLDDDELTVQAYALAVGLSRAQLHRKLKALTDLSAREFIRDRRLQHGAALLRGRHGNVTEVSYAVGFKNPSHFARCFRERYGVAPSAFAGENTRPGDRIGALN